MADAPSQSFTKDEEAAISKAMAPWLPAPLEHDPVADHQRKLRQIQDRAVGAVRRADRAARRGDAADAKRWGELATKLAEALRVLVATPILTPEEDAERMRKELRERIMKIANAERALDQWKMRRDIWEEMAAEARRVGAPLPSPLPPRPAHWSDGLSENLQARIYAEE